ncbi:hypothetical protein E4U17_007175 [Claviceps sp. LM77 group G4]|nr:hypothetical protein E4U17_007175 [Claviceps sp. LM77 group G4]KAG6058886.1 hypothetical protein E4U33_007182 [Claviceps sp. LM78 group G4]KAG6070254.1 hypothetical protein E4U16_007062 [Claviceps sp. LM84 group G4]
MSSQPPISGNMHAILGLLAHNPVPATLFTIAIIFLTSVLLFSSPASHHKQNTDGNAASPPSMPGYWLPFLAHGPQFLRKTGFLASLQKHYPEGIFSLKFLGKTHHVIHEPSLASTFMNRPKTTHEEKWLAARLLSTSFGLRKQDHATYGKLAHETPELFKHMLSEPGLGELVHAMVGQIKRHIHDFVTFNSAPADQMDWERFSDVDVLQNSKGETVVEADLMSLTRNFVAATANPALMGTNFVENFPEFWELLWKFDDGMVLLAANVPAWIPWPRLQRAKAARARMLARTLEFEVAMDKYVQGEDPGIQWQDLHNVSTYVKSRVELFRNRGLSLEARATCDVALSWAMNANANPLIFWLIYELCRDPVLLEIVREEIAPFVKIVQPAHDFGPAVWVAPEVESLDVDGLINHCPHLKAAYLETLRVYTGVWTVKWLTEDVTLKRRGSHADAFLLQKGDMAHVVHELHQFDADYFPNPKEWHHDRFLKEVDDGHGRKLQTVDMGTLRPFGGGPSMCKGRAFAMRELLLYSSFIISFYDICPPGGQVWEEPATCKRAASRYPVKPVRVWIKKRVFDTNSKSKSDSKSENAS